MRQTGPPEREARDSGNWHHQQCRRKRFQEKLVYLKVVRIIIEKSSLDWASILSVAQSKTLDPALTYALFDKIDINSSGNSTNLAFKIYLYLGCFLPLLYLETTLCISLLPVPRISVFVTLLYYFSIILLTSSKLDSFLISSVIAYVSLLST